MKPIFRLIWLSLLLPSLSLLGQQNRVVDSNSPPTINVGATNVPWSFDIYGRLLVNSGNPTGSPSFRIGQSNITPSMDSRGRVLVVDSGGGGGGSGTVTSFSAGDLSPLFTTSVATATTTPALSFSLNTHAANTVFAGPTTGADAAPTFRALVTADLPSGTATTGTGTVNTLAKYTSASAIGNSLLTDDGTTLGYTGTGGFSLTGGSAAGVVRFGQGTAPSAGTTNISLAAPASVTSYIRILPGAVGSTGYVKETVSGSTQTESVVATIPSADVAVGALADGMTATTKAAGSNDTKLATNAYADTATRATFTGSMATPSQVSSSPTWVSPVLEIYLSTEGGTPGTRDVTLPAAASYTGQAIIIYVAVTATSSRHINFLTGSGAVAYLAGTIMTSGHYVQCAAPVPGNYMILVSDGVNWISHGSSGTWTDAASA